MTDLLFIFCQKCHGKKAKRIRDRDIPMRPDWAKEKRPMPQLLVVVATLTFEHPIQHFQFDGASHDRFATLEDLIWRLHAAVQRHI
jgi:hypothetical protein